MIESIIMKEILLFLILTTVGCIHVNAQDMKIKITVGNKEFTATLNDNEAAKELVKLLPMEVNMGEHNGNEKYYNLPKRMPGKATNPGKVNVGDLMLWSSNTLVLFYAGSSTSYSYIKLGQINNTSGLRDALGRGSITVKFENIEQK